MVKAYSLQMLLEYFYATCIHNQSIKAYEAQQNTMIMDYSKERQWKGTGEVQHTFCENKV